MTDQPQGMAPLRVVPVDTEADLRGWNRIRNAGNPHDAEPFHPEDHPTALETNQRRRVLAAVGESDRFLSSISSVGSWVVVRYLHERTTPEHHLVRLPGPLGIGPSQPVYLLTREGAEGSAMDLLRQALGAVTVSSRGSSARV